MLDRIDIREDGEIKVVKVDNREMEKNMSLDTGSWIAESWRTGNRRQWMSGLSTLQTHSAMDSSVPDRMKIREEEEEIKVVKVRRKGRPIGSLDNVLEVPPMQLQFQS